MPYYIDAEKLMSIIIPKRIDNDTVVEVGDILRGFAMTPTADVAPVVHAKWEKIQRTAHYTDSIGIDVETGKPFINKKEYNYDEYRCPVCKKFAKGDYLRFCDYCGARFDEMFREDEEEKQ